MNPIAREPVIVQVLAAAVVWAATRYGLQVSDEQALQIAGGAFIVLAPFVRQLVRPTVKDEGPLTPEEVEKARALLETYQPQEADDKAGPAVAAKG